MKPGDLHHYVEHNLAVFRLRYEQHSNEHRIFVKKEKLIVIWGKKKVESNDYESF